MNIFEKLKKNLISLSTILMLSIIPLSLTAESQVFPIEYKNLSFKTEQTNLKSKILNFTKL